MTLVEDVTAWALGCGAEEAAAAQPGSGGGVPHTHGKTELRFNGGEAARKRRGPGGSHTRTVKPNSGSTAGRQRGSGGGQGGPTHAR